jgi:hypothetical protein
MAQAPRRVQLVAPGRTLVAALVGMTALLAITPPAIAEGNRRVRSRSIGVSVVVERRWKAETKLPGRLFVYKGGRFSARCNQKQDRNITVDVALDDNINDRDFYVYRERPVTFTSESGTGASPDAPDAHCGSIRQEIRFTENGHYYAVEMEFGKRASTAQAYRVLNTLRTPTTPRRP